MEGQETESSKGHLTHGLVMEEALSWVVDVRISRACRRDSARRSLELQIQNVMAPNPRGLQSAGPAHSR